MGVFLYRLHKLTTIFEIMSQFSVIRASCRQVIFIPGVFSHLSSVPYILECALRHDMSEHSAQMPQHRSFLWVCCDIASCGMNIFARLKIRGTFFCVSYL